MRIRVFAISVCLLGFYSLAAEAAAGAFRLAVDRATSLSEAEHRRAETWLEEVERLVPIEMKARIAGTIPVEFREMRVGPNALLSCSGQAHGKRRERGNDQIVGFTKPSFSRSGGGKIVVARELLSFFASEVSRSQASCHHRRADLFAHAVILHELAHAFDESGDFGLDEAFDREQCATFGDRVVMLRSFDDCQAALTARGRISESAFYRRTSGFKARAELFALPRSPDAYETTHVREHFAVNFEHFILDPEYACRRPQTNRALRQIFSSARPPVCEPNLEVLDAETSEIHVVDPSRIFQIDYLQAGPGSALMSRWGHSMLRLIVCAPSRRVVDSECRKDTAFHLIVGFGALTETGRFDNLAGVMGRYPSQLSVLRYESQALNYTSLELRSLMSLPLRLKEREKTALIENLLQTFWEYRGRYYFFSNNCSTETFRFLRAVLPLEHPIHAATVSPSLTPEGLLEALARSGLVDPTQGSESKDHIRQGTFIASAERTLMAAFEVVRPFIQSEGLAAVTFREYAELRARERAEALSSTKGRREIAAFLMLERWAGRQKQALVLEGALAEGAGQGDQGLKFKKERQRLLGTLRGAGEFGIPSRAVLNSALAGAVLRETAESSVANALEGYFSKHPSEKQEFEGTRQNIRALEDALALHVQSF